MLGHLALLKTYKDFLKLISNILRILTNYMKFMFNKAMISFAFYVF